MLSNYQGHHAKVYVPECYARLCIILVVCLLDECLKRKYIAHDFDDCILQSSWSEYPQWLRSVDYQR